MMASVRTTINIDDSAFHAIQRYAEEHGVSLGKATSDLVHRGVESLPEFKTKNGWVIFERPPGSPPITPGLVTALEEEGYDEEFQRAISPRR